MAKPPDAPSPAMGMAVLLLPLLLLLFHGWYYIGYFCDDAFISMRYAERFFRGQGLTWNEGEYVEGYSNLLWVLWVAFLGWLGMPLLYASYLIGGISALAVFAALCWHACKNGYPPLLVFIVNMALALCAPMAIWLVGGMESMLLAALLAWAYALALRLMKTGGMRPALPLGFILGLVSLTRPEGFAFTAIIAIAVFLCTSLPRRALVMPLLGAVCLSGLCCLGQVLFRLAYYGLPLPNTYYAKVAFTLHRLQTGWEYVYGGMASLWPLLLVVLLCLAWAAGRRIFAHGRELSFCLFTGLAWLALVWLGGGDIFPGYRHILPVLPLLAMALLRSLSVLRAGLAPRARLLWACALPLLALLAAVQTTTPENRRAFADTYQWYGQELGLILKKRYGKTRPLIAVTMAGAIPFYSGLPAVDMLGLADRFITLDKGRQVGSGTIGHELWAPEYYFFRKPDIFIFGYHDAPWHNLDRYSEFQAYEPETIKLKNGEARIWLRKGSPKLNAQ